jgi:chemotaxis protein CheY-P-specific phosphatase CheC
MVGTLLMLSGDIEGMMMFLIPIDIASDLVNMLMSTNISSHEEIDEMGYSVINEV